MPGIPLFFNTPSQAVASYDWNDFTTGLGYRRYYPCIATISGSVNYVLSNKVLDSQPRCISGSTNQHFWVALKDVDFDIPVNVPTISGAGTAWVNFSIYSEANGMVYADVNVYHVTAGGVETLIGSASSTPRDRTAPALASYFRECISMALTSQSFAIGEKLRVNVILKGWGVSGTPAMYLYCDPASKVTFTDFDTSTIGSDMTIDLPFKIDL